MNSPQMHSEQAGATKCKRDGCPVLFKPKTRWQTFCSVKCRNTQHRTLSPESMRKEIDALKAQVAQLQQDAHPPFDFDALVRRLERLEAIARGEVLAT